MGWTWNLVSGVSAHLLMSSLLCISMSGCSDCCLDLLHLTACILMLVSDMNLSEQWSHWRLVSRVSSWSLRSRKISRCSLFCSLSSELDFLSEVALVSAEAVEEAAPAARLSSASSGLCSASGCEARSVSRPGGDLSRVSPLSVCGPLQKPVRNAHWNGI